VTAPAPDTVDLPGLDLMAVGTWNASTGRTTVTAEDIADAVKAFNDGLVDRPAIKIGHTDSRFRTAGEDGDPAYGWVTNVRLSEDGRRLVGDAKRVPAKLAARMGDAYRNRSAEVKFGVRTLAGKTYRMVLTGLALLGAQPPAIKTLDDVYALYSDQLFAEGATYEAAAAVWVGDTPTIRGPQAGAVDGGQEHLSAAIGGPVDYPAELLTALGLPAGSGDADVLAAATAARSFSAAPEGAPPATGTTDGAAAAGQGAAPQATVPAAPAAATFPPASPPATLTTTEGPEVVTITRAMWEQMEAAIAQAAESARELGGQRKKELIGAALSQGRITAADVQSFSALFDKDEQQATALLTTLTPRIHTFSAGHSQVPAFAAAPVNGPATDADAKASMELLGLPYTGKAAS
jgi:hypothetical protein